MRDITRRHLRVLNSEGWLPIILADIRLAGTSVDSTIYLTNAGEVITWNGHDYMAVNMARGLLEDIVSTDASSAPSLTIQISNVDKQMAALLNGAILDDAEVVVNICDRRLLANPRDAIRLTKGRLRNPQLSAASFVFQVANIIGQLDEVLLPKRLWKADCSYIFGSPACGVDIKTSPNTISTTVLAGSTSQYVVVDSSVIDEAGIPAIPNDYWTDGYLVFVDGPNAAAAQQFGQFQFVGTEYRFYVKSQWKNTPAIGNTVLIRRGCPKTKAACIERQGNINSFGGFEEVPYGNIIPAIIGGIDEKDEIWTGAGDGG